MDIGDSPEEAAFRAEARAFLEAHAPRKQPGVTSLDELNRHDPTWLKDHIEHCRSWQHVLYENGWAGITWPKEFGGRGGTNIQQAVYSEEESRFDVTAGVFSVGLGMVAPTLMVHGTPEQQERYLDPMLRGDELWCQLFSEPDAGSDAAAIRTRAVRDGDVYRLTGTKIWISNAPEADRYLVFATLDPAAGPKAITAFLVEKGMPGFRFGAHEKKMGIRACPAAELVFEDAVVPIASRLGEEGDGYRIALSSLAEGRISIAAACVGIARSALEQAAAYLPDRRAFGGPLAEQQGLRFMLAEMARDVEAARALTRQAAAAKDRGEPIGVPSSLAKWTASDTAMRVAIDAVQLFGSSGYSRETGIERLMRDAKGAQIYEGTNQIHRLIVADELLGRSG